MTFGRHEFDLELRGEWGLTTGPHDSILHRQVRFVYYGTDARGGIVNLDEGFKFSLNNSASQHNPDLFHRAYQVAWLHNVVSLSTTSFVTCSW